MRARGAVVAPRILPPRPARRVLPRSSGVAPVRNMPGVTRSIDFYGAERRGPRLVDLPGYGFAVADPEAVLQWQVASPPSRPPRRALPAPPTEREPARPDIEPVTAGHDARVRAPARRDTARTPGGRRSPVAAPDGPRVPPARRQRGALHDGSAAGGQMDAVRGHPPPPLPGSRSAVRRHEQVRPDRRNRAGQAVHAPPRRARTVAARTWAPSSAWCRARRPYDPNTTAPAPPRVAGTLFWSRTSRRCSFAPCAHRCRW